MQVKDLSQSSGAFAVTINDGTGTRLDSTGYTKVTTDAQGRVTVGATLLEADLPNITTAGKIAGGAISAGTMGGSTAINTSGNLVTSGTVSGLTVGATNLRVYNGTLGQSNNEQSFCGTQWFNGSSDFSSFTECRSSDR